MGKRLVQPLQAQSRLLGTSSRTEQLASSCSILLQTSESIFEQTKMTPQRLGMPLRQSLSSKWLAVTLSPMTSSLALENTLRSPCFKSRISIALLSTLLHSMTSSLAFYIIPGIAHWSWQRQGQGCFSDQGNQSTTSLGCCSYPTCWLSTLCIIIHLSMSPKLTLLILWQARPLPMQVLFAVACQKVLQIKQEQGQEAGPGPGCKFITEWIPGDSQVSRKCKSPF